MGMSMKTTCKKCSKEMEPSETRALSDGKGFICVNCFENTSDPSSFDKNKLRKPHASASNPTRIDTTNGFFEKKEYICDACNYKFNRSPEFIVCKCPFCGKAGFVHMKVDQAASEFLRE
jgi:predicted RNA-binding Zn-ribbon protein involved in translation (DUF1610 family)